MSSGPCMCGDPYCWSCGDPAQARLADCIDSLAEQIGDFIESPIEADLIWDAGKAAVLKAREMATEVMRDQAQGYEMEIERLQDRIDELESQAKGGNNN